MRVATVSPVTSRFGSPADFKKLEAQLHKAEVQLNKATGAVAAQEKMMRQARFTPELFKAAQEKLSELQGNVSAIQQKVGHLERLLRSA